MGSGPPTERKPCAKHDNPAKRAGITDARTEAQAIVAAFGSFCRTDGKVLTPSEHKKKLRNEARGRRLARTPETRRQANADIRAHLEALPVFRAADTILSYVSLPREVDTHPLFRDLLRQGRRVLVPRCLDKGQLEWCPLSDWNDLEPGDHGVLAPRADIAAESSHPADSVCLVPGLAFDHNGYRLGYGGGYFDRFLAGYPGTSIGLITEDNLLPRLPREAHDIPVNMVLTEDRAYPTTPRPQK